MKKIVAALVVSLALFVGASAAPTGVSIPGTVGIAQAHTCSAGYKHAIIDGEHKCLRKGQFCKHSADSQYKKYKFRCIKKNNGGRYYLTAV